MIIALLLFVTASLVTICNSRLDTELQKRGGIEDISKIIFLISQQKHML